MLICPLGYLMISMGILCLIYLICSVRTNLVFFLIFFTLVPAFGLLAATFFLNALGKLTIAAKTEEAAGAFVFVTCILGWYILMAIMLASVDFPFDLPSKHNMTRYSRRAFTNLMQSSISRGWSRVRARRRRLTTSSKHVPQLRAHQDRLARVMRERSCPT
jgi:hypothetical protein